MPISQIAPHELPQSTRTHQTDRATRNSKGCEHLLIRSGRHKFPICWRDRIVTRRGIRSCAPFTVYLCFQYSRQLRQSQLKPKLHNLPLNLGRPNSQSRSNNPNHLRMRSQEDRREARARQRSQLCLGRSRETSTRSMGSIQIIFGMRIFASSWKQVNA